jgi:hypothetical protein|tara:strand:- start:1228 stop:1734 length:507 start_codon:yes stop_codon:yes gene_type:complete
MDNKIEKGKYFYDIEKMIFFNNLKNINMSSANVLEQFKKNFKDIDYTLNQKNIQYSGEILEFLLKKYKKYLEEILLFCSFFSINESLKQIKNILWSTYHIIENKQQNPTIDIQLNILIKQVILSYVVNIVEFTKNTSVVINKKVNVSIIFNVANYKYLRIVLEIVKQN